MTDDILARAEQAMEGVTEGPWEYPEMVLGCPSAAIFQGGDEGRAEVLIGLAHPADGRFIAAARTLVPELVAALRESRAERYEARMEAKQQAHEHGEAWAKEYTAARQAEVERDEARAEVDHVRRRSEVERLRLGTCEGFGPADTCIRLRGHAGPCRMPDEPVDQSASPAEPVDLVNHPPHYKAGGMEAIDVIEAFAATNYHRASALKYLLRAGRKDNTVQDLEKAVWYIRREIERRHRDR